MPISANYSWSEKKDSIKLSIPLKGVSPTKVDIFGKNFYLLSSMLVIYTLIHSNILIKYLNQLLK